MAMTMEVHACFRAWWSYVRSGYVLFDQALIGVQANNVGHVQAAMASSQYLSLMAASMMVDRASDESLPRTRSRLGPRGGYPFAHPIPLQPTPPVGA
jgi:hypothetical protein